MTVETVTVAGRRCGCYIQIPGPYVSAPLTTRAGEADSVKWKCTDGGRFQQLLLLVLFKFDQFTQDPHEEDACD